MKYMLFILRAWKQYTCSAEVFSNSLLPNENHPWSECDMCDFYVQNFCLGFFCTKMCEKSKSTTFSTIKFNTLGYWSMPPQFDVCLLCILWHLLNVTNRTVVIRLFCFCALTSCSCVSLTCLPIVCISIWYRADTSVDQKYLILQITDYRCAYKIKIAQFNTNVNQSCVFFDAPVKKTSLCSLEANLWKVSAQLNF